MQSDLFCTDRSHRIRTRGPGGSRVPWPIGRNPSAVARTPIRDRVTCAIVPAVPRVRSAATIPPAGCVRPRIWTHRRTPSTGPIPVRAGCRTVPSRPGSVPRHRRVIRPVTNHRPVYDNRHSIHGGRRPIYIVCSLASSSSSFYRVPPCWSSPFRSSRVAVTTPGSPQPVNASSVARIGTGGNCD